MKLTSVYFLYTHSSGKGQAMSKDTSFLIPTLQDIADAAAIIDENYFVYYVNKSFEKLFQFDGTDKRKKHCDVLSGLDLALSRDNEIKSPQLATVPDGQKKISVSIYLLNKSNHREHLYLVIAGETRKKAEKAYQANAANPYADAEKFRTEKLSPEFSELVGEDIEFRKALVIAQRAARSNISVLIIGESGTGKEILARAIHKTSPRSGKPLVDVNCAAIPDSLIESELFGYEKGAFTGARTEGRKGYFDEAHEGTILLDEIGDASLQTQSKLLRVLESGNFKRVGGTKNINVDVRIISSTNRDLSILIAQRAFREDLFFRLNAFTIYLPPLRDRRADIPPLVNHFLNSNDDVEKRSLKFSPSSMEILNSYHWPGNVRELKGVVNYAVNMTQDSLVSPSSLPNFLFTREDDRKSAAAALPVHEDKGYNLAEAVAALEKKLIEETLQSCSNRTMAIKKLGISRRTFYMKIKQYGLD
jgi:transcriptional regulator with PAS, ATPase and Fis domain